jgi:hypothetical protein
VREQPLVLHQRRQRSPQLGEAVTRLAAHAVSEEDTGPPQALIPEPLQPLSGLVASVLAEDEGGAKKLTKADVEDLFRLD